MNDHNLCRLCGLKDTRLMSGPREKKKNSKKTYPWMFSQLDNWTWCEQMLDSIFFLFLTVFHKCAQDAQMQTPMHMAPAAQDQLIPADVYVL